MKFEDIPFYTYDLETYPNCFLCSGKFRGQSEVYTFEISDRRNDRDALLSHLDYLKNVNAMMVGFRSLFFDYPIIHQLMNEPFTFTAMTGYEAAQKLIAEQSFGNSGNMNMIRMNDRLIKQLDLFKIHHFDNRNKSTSLKSLQFAMRSESVEDLPFKPGTHLTSDQIDLMRHYNIHDITETEKFFDKSESQIRLRLELLEQGVLSGDVLNFSDVKIGTEYLVKKIGRAKCYVSGSNPRQTFRESVAFKDIILPKIFYRTEEYNAILSWFKAQIIYTKSEEESPKLETQLAGITFKFGVGGVHASVENRLFETTEDYIIKDVDVSGMYPAVAIANDFYPEHLGRGFLDIYRQLQKDRKAFAKGSSMNMTLKLAGNGVFGNSDNMYSCFYDPAYAKKITVNGQLQLLQLAEVLSMIPGLKLIQANTDGITAHVPRHLEYLFNFWCSDWEKMTGLVLEHVNYSKMWIRDVNNYLAISDAGKVKRKGAYWYPETEKDYEGVWNKDFSMMIVQKLIGSCLIDKIEPKNLIRLATDKFDFMMRYKTTGGAKVYIGNREMLKTVRYYVSVAGEPMKKIAPPKGELGAYKRKNKLADAEYNKIVAQIPKGSWDPRIHTKNKSKYEQTETNIENGRLVKECNHVKDFNWSDVDFDYYTQEINKLMIGV